ncbi:MAG TPA: LytR C-terminal domain-containing protein [Microlunatus sp.]|nr:LytR C-terminal domain-containing protein [Microlunatus sp.]
MRPGEGSWSTLIGRVWRIVRTPLTLLVLLGILCYGAWWGYTNVLKPVPPLPPTPCVTQPIKKGQLSASQVTVNIYNGGSKRGLARDIGIRMRDRGFRVASESNTAEKIGATVIVGQGAKNPEVLLIKQIFPGSTVRVEPNRVDHSVDILVGNSWNWDKHYDEKAKSSLKVKAKTVCLPSIKTSTPAAAAGG